jgi:hypothetical protein
MRKILLFMVCFSLGHCARAQVMMSLRLPPLGLTIKPQLWNLSLINTSAADIHVRIEMTMTDVSNNQRVLTGTSRVMLLPRGVKEIQVSDVMPINYSAGSPGYTVDPNPDGFLPVGVFNICYSAIKIESDNTELLGEECETVEVEPISPPQLMMPLDEEWVDFTRPLFTWLPPSPYNTLGSLLYDWTLVEVQLTQSPADAIQQNIPVLERLNIAFNNLQYPLSAAELDTGKLYAWRVSAKNNTTPVGNSEIYSFRIRKYAPDTGAFVSVGYYSKLRRVVDASYIICGGVLRYEYLNELNEASVNLSIVDLSHNRQPVNLDSANYPVQYGQNFQQLDLRDHPGMVDKHLYLLELTNAKQEKWWLKFEFRKENFK